MPRKRSLSRPATAHRARSGGLPVMTLRMLRESVAKTQGDVAYSAGMTQPQLSRVEHRRDHLISTVHKYVAALDGEVQLVAIVDGRRVILRDV